MLAATGLDIVKANFSYNLNEWALMLTGFVGSFLVALVIVKSQIEQLCSIEWKCLSVEVQ